MTQDQIIQMLHKIVAENQNFTTWTVSTPHLVGLVNHAIAKEREAIEALHEHEDVQAPIGNSSWGEAYQEGWIQGTAAYRAAIRARGQA